MADLILDGLHSVTGVCDWCGQECDPTAHDLNALDCSFKDCPPSVYHQECLEKFFKSNRLDKNRKTGFTCPRGRGKGSRAPQPCPGKVRVGGFAWGGNFGRFGTSNRTHCILNLVSYISCYSTPQIEKSHPILARSDLSKKRRKAVPPPPPPPKVVTAEPKEKKVLTPLTPLTTASVGESFSELHVPP